MKTILVTGCAGFIGSHIAERLLNEGHMVVGVDNFHPYYQRALKERNMDGFKKHKNFKFFEGSILDDKLLNILAKEDIDIINHQAAIAGVRNSIKSPLEYLSINTLGTLKLLDRFRDAEKFIFASSSSVYGDVADNELPIKEDRKPKPISPYALSKLQAEEWCKLFSNLYGIRSIILRYFTVYGPRQRPDEAVEKFMRKILSGEPIEIYGDGEQTRDFTYVGDVVNANILTLSKGSGVFNIASGKRISVNKLVELLKKATKKEVKVNMIERQIGDVSHTWANIDKSKNELGFRPATDIETGLRNQFEHVQSLAKSLPTLSD